MIVDHPTLEYLRINYINLMWHKLGCKKNSHYKGDREEGVIEYKHAGSKKTNKPGWLWLSNTTEYQCEGGIFASKGQFILWATCFSNSKHERRISLKNGLNQFFRYKNLALGNIHSTRNQSLQRWSKSLLQYTSKCTFLGGPCEVLQFHLIFACILSGYLKHPYLSKAV